MASAENCELCARVRITRVHFEDDRWWVVDCLFCGVPMAVYKRHVANPSAKVKAEARGLLRALFPPKPLEGPPEFDDSMRSIPDHYHMHMRGRERWGARTSTLQRL